MPLTDLLKPDPPAPSAPVNHPASITCEKYVPGEGKRCVSYLDNGACVRPDEFMCLEWMKHNANRPTGTNPAKAIDLGAVTPTPKEGQLLTRDRQPHRVASDLEASMTSSPSLQRNQHLSFSRVKRFALCPRSYQLHYLQKAPSSPNTSLLFGSLLHAALERVYREILAEKLSCRFPEDRLLAAYKDEWSRSSLTEFAVFQEGLAILGAFARQHALIDHASVLAVEQEFRLPVERFQVLGYIDRVDKVDDETVAIVDYKSNRIIFTREEIDHDLQLSIYAMAARMLWPWAKNIRLGLYLLRHGILMETTRSEEDLAAAREYIAMLGRQTETATDFPARLNENCQYCEHRDQCPTYHRALLGKVEAVCQDENDLEAVAREREEVARMAKVLYARKEALERILKVRLREIDRLDLGGMVYTIGKTTQISYPTAPTLTAFRELTGKDEDELVPLLLSVEKGKVDTFVKDLSKSMGPADARMLKARIEAIAEKSVSPRFNAQRATIASGTP